MAYQEHLDRLREGVEAWNHWRAANPWIAPDLTDADLCGLDLSGANLFRADLTGAKLCRAKLIGTNLSWTDLDRAKLCCADLSGADLYGSTLIETNLSDANLTGCMIYGIAAWRLTLTPETTQAGLRVTRWDEPEITVDDITVAQFV